MSDFASFLRWEANSRDTIDFKKIYVDIAGDLNAGLMLSELIYWYLPSQGSDANKLRVERDGFQWVAVRRYQWWERTRLSPDQSDRALNILCKKGLAVKRRYKFAGEVTVHVRILEEAFLAAWETVLNNPIVNPFLPKPEMELPKKAKSKTAKKQKQNAENPEILLTESTSKTTTKNQPARRLVFEAVAKHVFAVSDLKGLSKDACNRIGLLESSAKRVVNAYLPDATDERTAELVASFASRETFKPGIQGKPTFELKFKAYLDKTAKIIPLSPDAKTDLSEWVSPDPFDFLKSEGA